MNRTYALRNTARYWETETPEVMAVGKTVLKVFRKNGKIQVYPRVQGSPNGVGRGATIDLEKMSAAEREKVKTLLLETITNYKVEK
jgi:hypothetical protein